MNLHQLKRPPAIKYGPDPSQAAEKYTVVILGVPRGGTTMVAGVVQRCGINLGENLPPNLEDPAFAGPPIRAMRKTIAERNEVNDIWGWKYPRAAGYLPHIARETRNLRLIAVWRDAVAISGHRIADGSSVENALKAVITMQQRNLRLLDQLDCPRLVVSYERAILEPIPFLEMIAEFLYKRMPPDMNETLQFMRPGAYK